MGVVPMDLAHITGLVTRIGKHVRQGPVVGIEVQFVDDHARRRSVFARYEAGAVSGTHGTDRHGVGKIERLACEPVDVGRHGQFVAGVTQHVGAQLVRHHVDDVGTLLRPGRPCKACQRTCSEQVQQSFVLHYLDFEF